MLPSKLDRISRDQMIWSWLVRVWTIKTIQLWLLNQMIILSKAVPSWDQRKLDNRSDLVRLVMKKETKK